MFYESKGWMIGKNKMVSWKGAVGGWNSRQRNEGRRKYRNIPTEDVGRYMNEPEEPKPEMTFEEWEKMFGEENA